MGVHYFTFVIKNQTFSSTEVTIKQRKKSQFKEDI